MQQRVWRERERERERERVNEGESRLKEVKEKTKHENGHSADAVLWSLCHTLCLTLSFALTDPNSSRLLFSLSLSFPLSLSLPLPSLSPSPQPLFVVTPQVCRAMAEKILAQALAEPMRRPASALARKGDDRVSTISRSERRERERKKGDRCPYLFLHFLLYTLSSSRLPLSLSLSLAPHMASPSFPQLMEHFLAERVRIAPAPGRDVRRQQLLYTAAFWAKQDAVQALLKEGAGTAQCAAGRPCQQRASESLTRKRKGRTRGAVVALGYW